MIYHVSLKGSDSNCGSADLPFKTINKAASIAVSGDTVRVHGGVYRECVDPKNGGMNDGERITYEAVEGERPVIKGSELVSGWERIEERVWKKAWPNAVFGGFNPFKEKLFGDWVVWPDEYDIHLGDVYLNGISMYEAISFDALRKAEKRIEGFHHPESEEKILYPEQTVYQWYAEVGETETVLFCNFGEYDPNRETVEISVRPCCFFPKKTGINYITVRGFEMAHAATPWAPPTAEQIGIIGPHWSKGWIIEDNVFHDAKCSAVSLGKEITTGQNLHSRFMKKPGYQYQQEAVFLALRAGWSKDTIGSHLVRNNTIYDCGQAGIVGHMGCIFSRVEHNEIYHINRKQEFWGHEVAGIKFHAAIDTVIENNNIHDCNLGMWLDWQAQGTRVTRNLFHNNARDLFIEVTHGPCLVDNNLFLSPHTLQEASQGTAYVHNIIAGPARQYATLDRATPYHYPHSTEVAGCSVTLGGDHRIINNIIIGNIPENDFLTYPGTMFEGYSTPEEYMPEIEKYGIRVDEGKYFKVPQPVWMEENAYSGYARPFRCERGPIITDKIGVFIEETFGEWILTLDVPASVANAKCKPLSTERLGAPRITECKYEAPDGTPVDLSYDLCGERRGDESVTPGPISKLREGTNRMIVWRANQKKV